MSALCSSDHGKVIVVLIGSLGSLVQERSLLDSDSFLLVSLEQRTYSFGDQYGPGKGAFDFQVFQLSSLVREDSFAKTKFNT